jgi:hypothetical protein
MIESVPRQANLSDLEKELEKVKEQKEEYRKILMK